MDDTVETAEKTPSFSGEFQGKVAALCLRDSTFLRQVEGLVRPEYFEDTDVGMSVDVAQRYFNKYQKTCGDMNVFMMFVKDLARNKILKKEDAIRVIQQANELWKSDISDRQYVVDKVSKFARHAAVSNAIIEIAEKHLDASNFDAIEKTLKNALLVGAYSDTISYDYGAGIEARTEERIARQKGELPPEGITTGYPELDAYLQPNNGWGRKELSVLMGPAKAGKSTALMDFGLSACGNRFNVLYVTLEVSQRIIAQRADAHLANIATNELGVRNQSAKLAVQDWRSKAGKFMIEERPTGTMKVSDLRRLIEQWKTKGLVFDLVVVDYADLMAPEHRNNSHPIENSRQIWTDLRALASEENFALLTATQTNREGAKKMVSDMTDVAEDFNKIRLADVVISINKTDEERMRNECRLHFVAIRNAEGGFSVRVKQNIACMQFVTEVLGVE